MAREIKTSSEIAGVYQRQSGVVGKGIESMGKGVQSLGGSMQVAKQRDDAWELTKLKHKKAEEQRLAALSLKTQKALDDSQIELQTSLAKDRGDAFLKTQALNSNPELLSKNLEDFNSAESAILEGLKANGTVSNTAYNELKGLEYPKIAGKVKSETGYQINVAQGEQAIGNYNALITSANNKGDFQTANNIIDTMVYNGLLDSDVGETRKTDNSRLSERGLFKLQIINSKSQDGLDIINEGLAEGKYEHLNLEDQYALQDMVQNQKGYLWKSEQVPAVKAVRNAFEAGTLTQDQIATSAMPQLDKDMYSMRLRLRREYEYTHINADVLGSLSKQVNDYLDGGYIGAGGSKRQAESIMKTLNGNKVPDYVISDILNIMFDGEASENGVKFLNLDRNDVKYPKKMVAPMEAAKKEFNSLTNDLSPRERIDAFGKFYFPTYQYHYGALNAGKRLLGMDVPEVNPIEIIRAERIERDSIASGENALGIKRGTPAQQTAYQLAEGADLGMGADNDAVRAIMRVGNISLEEAKIIFERRGN